jgi:hypothetical protein
MYLKRLLKAITIIIILSLLLTSLANAAETPSLQDSCAAALVKLDIMHKDTKGNLKLNDKIKRYEFIVLVNSAMSYDQADTKDVKISFKDVSSKHKAYNDIKTAVGHDLIDAYSDNTIKPDKIITNAEALNIVIRGLGYGKTIPGNEPETTLKKAVELGLINNPELPSTSEMSRGEAAVIIYNALTVTFSK